MNDELMAQLVLELSGIKEELAGIREAQVKSGWVASLPHYIGVVLAIILAITVVVFFFLSTSAS